MTDNEALALKVGISVLVLGGVGAGAYFIWKGRQARAQLGMGTTTPPLGVSPTATETSRQQIADGTVHKVWSDGSSTSEHPDGTVEATSSTGSKVTQHTDGTVSARTASGQVTTPPRREVVESETLKDPGQAFIGRITTGPSFDACLSEGHVWSRTTGCTDQYYDADQHRAPNRTLVTDGEQIRDAQRRLLASGFFNNPDGSVPANVVGGSVGPHTREAVLRFQQRFNMARGFGPEQNYRPDGSELQSRTAYLPVTGTLDYLTYQGILQS